MLFSYEYSRGQRQEISTWSLELNDRLEKIIDTIFQRKKSWLKSQLETILTNNQETVQVATNKQLLQQCNRF